LATSPISPSSLSQMKAGIAALKAASSADMALAQDDQMTPVVEHSGTIVTMEDGKMVVSAIPPSDTLLSAATVEDERHYFSDSEVPCVGSTGRRRRQSSVATQTYITASDVDYIRSERCATPPGAWYSNLSSTGCGSAAVAESSASDVTVVNSSQTCLPDPSILLLAGMPQPESGSHSLEKDMRIHVATEDCQFDMDFSDDEVVHRTPTMSIVTESSVFGRCASLPSITQQQGFDESTDAWAASQYMSVTRSDYISANGYS